MELIDSKLGMILITINTMLIPGVYWAGFDRFLYDKKYMNIMKTIVISLFIIGILLGFFSKGDRFILGIAFSFFSPSYHLFLYRQLRNMFIKKFKREPKDVAFNFKTGLLVDRTFAICFVLFSTFSSMTIVGLFIWNYSG